MGTFRRGDVVIAAVTLGKRDVKKTRPVVMVADQGNSSWLACPISSTPPYDNTPSIPLDLQDFEEGGLDIMLASYVLAGHPLNIRASDVMAKKGTLSGEVLEAIISLVSGSTDM